MNINDLEKYYSRRPLIRKANGKFVTTKTHGSFVTNYKSLQKKDTRTHMRIKDEKYRLFNLMIKHAPEIIVGK